MGAFSLNQESKQLRHPLSNMRSLPNSLTEAWSILEIQRLGKFSTYKRTFLEINADIEMISSRFEQSELLITALSLAVLSSVVASLTYFLHFDISFTANFVQILTFAIALTLLLLRFWPKREISFNKKSLFKLRQTSENSSAQ